MSERINGDKIIIVAAPSGAGKSSFVERISREDSRLVDIITYTTRTQRQGESEGHPYHFITKDDFNHKVETGFFVEYAKVHTNMYGTPWDQIRLAWSKNKCVIMDIDVQGTETFRRKFPQAKTIFILPPSIDELRRRIQKRDAVLPADFEVRMQNAAKEMALAHEFNYQIINDDFDRAYAEFKKIVDVLLA